MMLAAHRDAVLFFHRTFVAADFLWPAKRGGMVSGIGLTTTYCGWTFIIKPEPFVNIEMPNIPH